MATDEPRIDPITRLAARIPLLVALPLLVFAVACLVPVLVYGRSAFFAPSAPAAVEANPENPDEPPPLPPLAAVDPHRSEHVVYVLGGLVGAILATALAVYVFTVPPTLGEPQKLTRARIGLLASGSLLGSAVMLFALGLLIVWFESISKWLDAGDAKQAYRVMIPVVAALVGAAMMFLGALPARAEERNNPLVRRLIYGTNLGLSALLLFFALLAGNILLALKLPNKLDTTETGFYTLTEGTKKYLAGLEHPLIITTNISARERMTSDINRLLEACQELNPERIKVRSLSNTLDKKELEAMQAKYPQYNLNSLWVIVASAEDENRSSFIGGREMFQRSADQASRTERETFVGESKLMREVLFLTDDKHKPVVYFTQGHGELSIENDPQQQVPPNRSAKMLRAFLEKNYVDVRPWSPTLKDAKVPDDATVVIVADPRSTIPPETATALLTYMTTQFPGGRRGKLIVLSSPFPTVKGRDVAETGLEGLLADYQIVLNKGYLMTVPLQKTLGFGQFIGHANESLVLSGNSLATAIQSFPLQDVREVTVRPTEPGAAISANVLVQTFPPNRITWIDPQPPVDPAAQFQAMMRTPELQPKYRASQRAISIAAAASEGKTPRVVVFGSGTAFADGRNEAPPVDVIAASIDWLRDRPTLAAINKPYSNYSIPRTASEFRLFWLPVGLVLLGTTVAGLGVWIIRRK